MEEPDKLQSTPSPAQRYPGMSGTEYCKLEDAFQAQGPGGPRIVVLIGPPSSKTTSVAKQFAAEKVKDGHYNSVSWINAESEETIWAAWLQLWYKNATETGSNFHNFVNVIENVLRKLNEAKPLVVFDGLPETSQINQILQKYILGKESASNVDVLLITSTNDSPEPLNLETVNLSQVILRDESVPSISTILNWTRSENHGVHVISDERTALNVHTIFDAMDEEPETACRYHGEETQLESFCVRCVGKLIRKCRSGTRLTEICALFGPCDIPMEWMQNVLCNDTLEQDHGLAFELRCSVDKGVTNWNELQRSKCLKPLVRVAKEPKVILFFREFFANFVCLISSFDSIEVAKQRQFERLSCLLENLLWMIKELTPPDTDSPVVLVRDVVTFVLSIHEIPWCQPLTAKYLKRISAMDVQQELKEKMNARLEIADNQTIEDQLSNRMVNLALNQYASAKYQFPSKPVRNFNFKLQIPSVWANRDEELLKLQKALEENTSVVVIHGMAGIGKTALAQYYGCWAYLQGRYDNYIWIDASEYASMSDDFRKLMVSGLCLPPLPGHVNGQMAAEAVYNSILADPTLIVFDNARGGEDDGWLKSDGIQGFFPGLFAAEGTAAPTVIVTTRNGDTWDNLNVKLLPLGFLKTDSLTTYIKDLGLVTVTFAEDQILNIADESEGHPVLLGALFSASLKHSDVKLCSVSCEKASAALPVDKLLCHSMIEDLERHPYGSTALTVLKVCAALGPGTSLDSIFEVAQQYPEIKKLRNSRERVIHGLATLRHFSVVHIINQQVALLTAVRNYVLEQLSIPHDDNRKFWESCLPSILQANFKLRGSDAEERFEKIKQYVEAYVEAFPEYSELQRIMAEAKQHYDLSTAQSRLGAEQEKLQFTSEDVVHSENKTGQFVKLFGEPKRTTSAAAEFFGGTSKSFEDQVTALMENHKLKLDESRRDVILMTGRAGVGKSTMAEILFGDVSSLESTFDEERLCNRIKSTTRSIGTKEHSMFQSETICPQLFIDQTNPGIAIYDCPGFADTRGTSNEIATGLYLSEILDHAHQVKLVAIVDYESVKPNADRYKFINGIIPDILDLVLDNTIYDGGVFLLVTRYANPYDSDNKFDDDVIIRSIANFLKEAQKYAVQNSPDGRRKDALNALFENSWLRQTGGKYSNIAFSRTITSEGKLSEMELLTRRTSIRNQLLDNPLFVFKPSIRQHFGSPISAAAVLEIRRIRRNLGSELEELLRSVGRIIIHTFVESAKHKDQISKFFDYYINFLNDLVFNQMPEENFDSTFRSIEILDKFSHHIEADTESEMSKLHEIVKRLKYLSGVDAEESAATWRDACSNLNETIMRMAKDMELEFINVQRDMTAEASQLLNLVVQKVVMKCASSPDSHVFEQFDVFSNDLRSLQILGAFCSRIGEDSKSELDKLVEIINCLNYMTAPDAEQSSTIYVHQEWNHAIDFMKKNIIKLKVQRDLAEANAQRQQAVAKARADMAAAEAAKQVAAAKAAAELAAANAEAERAKAKAEQHRLLAETERANAEARAKLEIAAANQREIAAEAAAAAESRRGIKNGISRIFRL